MFLLQRCELQLQDLVIKIVKNVKWMDIVLSLAAGCFDFQPQFLESLVEQAHVVPIQEVAFQVS